MSDKAGVHSVDIVVPCFNEEDSLPLFFAAYLKLVNDEPKYSFNIIIVDNGSADGTLKLAKEFISTPLN